MRGNGLHALPRCLLVETHQRRHGAFRFGAAEDMAGGQAVTLRISGPHPDAADAGDAIHQTFAKPVPAILAAHEC